MKNGVVYQSLCKFNFFPPLAGGDEGEGKDLIVGRKDDYIKELRGKVE